MTTRDSSDTVIEVNYNSAKRKQLPLVLSLVSALSVVLASCGTLSTEYLEIDGTFRYANVITPSIITVVYDVTNPYAQAVDSATCVLDPLVSATSVSDGFGEGLVFIDNLAAGETRRLQTDVTIKEGQGAYVSKVEITCSTIGNPSEFTR